MTPNYFRSSFLILKRYGFVESQAEFCALIGRRPQWLKNLGHSSRRRTCVREYAVARFRARLRSWEFAAPRTLKPIFTDLLTKLDDAERIETMLRAGR